MEQDNQIRKGLSPLLTILTGILCLGLSGGGTWYVMNQKVKKADETVGDLNERVAELEKKSSEKPKITVK